MYNILFIIVNKIIGSLNLEEVYSWKFVKFYIKNFILKKILKVYFYGKWF